MPITSTQVETAALLINLGLTTIDKIRSLFASQSDSTDDAQLAASLAEVEARLTRRGVAPPPPPEPSAG